MSDHTDNPVEDEEMTRAIDTDARDEERAHVRPEEAEEERWIEDESRAEDDDPGGNERRDRDRDWDDPEAAGGGRGGWDDENPIAPRPRGRLLRPLPLALIAVAIAAGGFLGGVEAQKGSEGGSGSGSLPGGGEVPAFISRGGPSGSESSGSEDSGPTSGGTEAAGEGGSGSSGEGATAEGGATRMPSFGGAEPAATGTVTSVEGHTIYVKESDGTVVAVKAGDGSTVTRESNVAAKKVHPGDTVVVQGSKHGSTVKASSIAATESGVESTLAFGGPAAASGSGNEGSGSEAEASVESLFEE
ncbi:MAG TPA: hypothetical protein VJL81_17785 [Solirubrobacterales bacterium]|nr:hypothetical protein [Solirubrobacterales bacterium]